MREADPTRGSPPVVAPVPAEATSLTMAMSDTDRVEDTVLPSRESGHASAEPEEDAEAALQLLSLAFDDGLCSHNGARTQN
jgi:hypothetical protein